MPKNKKNENKKRNHNNKKGENKPHDDRPPKNTVVGNKEDSGDKQNDTLHEHEPKPKKVIHIKKYGNRRLYSSSETRFVTIDELAKSVKDGHKVKVTDSDTDEDITSEILTQILLENGRAQHFPVEVLEQMIRVNEQVLRGFWSNYLDQSFKTFETFQKNWQDNWQKFNKSNLFFQWLGKPNEETSKAEAKPVPPHHKNKGKGSDK